MTAQSRRFGGASGVTPWVSISGDKGAHWRQRGTGLCPYQPARFLPTGIWTLLVAASVVSTAVLPGWLGLIGIPIGAGLLVGTLEFVGPNEEHGWPIAGTIVPIAYIAWSIWLIALGIGLLR
jgi:hypothetical protein